MKTELLRFNGAAQRDPAIDAWIKQHQGELGTIAHEWFEVMRNCGDEVREILHDGCPTACLGDVPFAYVNVFTSNVNVGFFQGASFPTQPPFCKAQASSPGEPSKRSNGPPASINRVPIHAANTRTTGSQLWQGRFKNRASIADCPHPLAVAGYEDLSKSVRRAAASCVPVSATII